MPYEQLHFSHKSFLKSIRIALCKLYKSFAKNENQSLWKKRSQTDNNDEWDVHTSKSNYLANTVFNDEPECTSIIAIIL